MQSEALVTEENAIDVLREETRRRSKGNRIILIFCGVLEALGVIALITSLVRHKDIDLMMIMTLVLPATLGMTMGMAPRHKAAAKLAARLEGPKVLGMLIETLDSVDPEIKALVLEMIKASATQDSKPGRLEPTQVQMLIKLATETKEPEVAVAALKLLSRWADSTALLQMDSLVEKGWSSGTEVERDKLRNQTRMAVSDLRLRLAREIVEPRGIEQTESLQQGN